MALITEQNETSIFKTKFSTAGAFVVTLLGLAILALAERVLYDTGRLLAPPPLDYFGNLNVILVHAVVIVILLAVALVANVALGERKKRYAMALVPYYVVSIILALQLILQVMVYFVNHHTTTEFYVVMLAIIAMATWGIYFAQKRFIESVDAGDDSSRPSTPTVIALVVVFAILFWVIYGLEGYPRPYSYNTNNNYNSYPQDAAYQQEMASRAQQAQIKNFNSVPGAYTFNAPASSALGLVGHWMLTDELPNVAQDSAGKNNAKGVSDPHWSAVQNQIASSPIKGVVYFQGNGAHMEVQNAPELTFQNGATITVAAWIDPHGFGQYNTIVSKDMSEIGGHHTNYALRVGFGDTPRKLEFYYGGANGGWQEFVSDNNVISTDIWQHVAATYTFGNAGSIKLYVNGNPVQGTWVNGDGNQSPTIINGPLFIGAENDAAYVNAFNGLIADVRIYNRALSAAEMAQLPANAKLPQGTFASQ